jgi:hypothetical protein
MSKRTVVLVAALGAVLLAGCAPKATIQVRWPRAVSERSIPRPAASVTWPLTGKPALDETAAASPVVALAVNGEPASASLPGLDSADVVYEIAMGSTDRLLALFHSSLPAKAGPLRAAEPSDVSLATAYGARLVQHAGPGPALADVASAASGAGTGTAPAQMAFGAAPATPRGSWVKLVSIPLADGSKAEWRFDLPSNSYQRFVDSKPALASGTRLLRATNVVVVWAPPPAAWPPTPMYGSGRASIFLADRRFVGSWEASGGPLVLRDETGAPLKLLPGNTWVEVIGTATDIVLQ